MSLTTKANLIFNYFFFFFSHSDNPLRPVLQGIFNRIKIPSLNLDDFSEKLLPLFILRESEGLS